MQRSRGRESFDQWCFVSQELRRWHFLFKWLSCVRWRGPIEAIFFFQNVHLSAVADNVERQIPANQTDIGPHRKVLQGWQGIGSYKKSKPKLNLWNKCISTFGPEGSHHTRKFSCSDNSFDPCPSGRSPAPTPCQPCSTFLCVPMSVWLGGIWLSTSVATPDECAFWKKIRLKGPTPVCVPDMNQLVLPGNLTSYDLVRTMHLRVHI